MAKKSAAKSDKPFDFEAGLEELEGLVERMEAGELSLEQSLRDFERGIELTRSCQKALEDAAQKVRILQEKDGSETLEPLDPPGDDD